MQDNVGTPQTDGIQDAQALSKQIKTYLEHNPQFFEQHPALLANLYLPSPHGSGTISLAERQQLAQRDKIRVLESRFAELVQMGSENEVTSNKIHALTLGLLASQQLDILVQLLQHYLRSELDVPNSALKLWVNPKDANDATNAAFEDVGQSNEATLAWVNSLNAPYCGSEPEANIRSGIDASAQSFAVIPLHSHQVFGVLILASDDARRFYPEMGTMFLKRIGELVSASLLRYID